MQESIGAKLARECAEATEYIRKERKTSFSLARVELRNAIRRARTRINERNYSDSQKEDIAKMEKALRALEDIEVTPTENVT